MTLPVMKHQNWGIRIPKESGLNCTGHNNKLENQKPEVTESSWDKRLSSNKGRA